MGLAFISTNGGAQKFQGATCDDSLYAVGLVGDQENFGPETRGAVDYRNASTWEIASNAAIIIGGIKGGIRGRRIVLNNVGAFTISLENSGLSDPENEFDFSVYLDPGACVVIQYSGILSKWILVSNSNPDELVGADASTDAGDNRGAVVSASPAFAGDPGSGGGVQISGGASDHGVAGSVEIFPGSTQDGTPGHFMVRTLFDGNLIDAFSDAAVLKIGFLGAPAVARQSITGATTQLQVDSLVAALVALGFATDDR